MSQEQKQGGHNKGSPGAVSLWFQRKMNARTTAKVRRKGGKYLGIDLLILHTTGGAGNHGKHRSPGSPMTTDGCWSPRAGGKRDPDWYANLMANPGQAAAELHGSPAVPVTPHRLAGDDRAQAWQRITAQQPRYAKYQQKSDREYPVVRLVKR